MSSVALEPAVEGYLSGDKLGKVVLVSQRLRLRIAHPGELLEDAWFRVETTKALRDPGWPLEELRELAPLRRREWEPLSISKDSLGFGDGGGPDEAAVAGLTRGACSADESILRVLDAKIPT